MNSPMRTHISKQKWLLGLTYLSIVVFLWVLSSFLVNDIFAQDLYRKPFIITYFNTGAFIFYLLPFIIRYKLDYRKWNVVVLGDADESNSEIGELINESSGRDSMEIENALIIVTSGTLKKDKRITLRETIKLSAQFCIIWYCANLTTNASLSYTSVGSQTILSSTSSFFTLIFGYLVHIEKINSKKVTALILSFIGVVLITSSDSSAPDTVDASSIKTFWGNVLALSGALFYGIYTILLKKKVEKESNMNMKLFFGFVGFFNLILIWPTLIIFHFLGIEKLELPQSSYIWKVLLINCSLTFISDFCWAKAMLLTTPLTVTVGLSFTIPLAMLGDYFFKDIPLNFIYVLGAIIVGISFFVINNDEEADNSD